MRESDKVRIFALKSGLRDLRPLAEKRGMIYTHLLTRDGLQYPLLRPMSETEMEVTALAQNCLAVIIPAETEFPFGESGLYVTARVLSYHKGHEEQHVRPGLLLDGTYKGSWVQTQNTRYGLLTQEGML